MRGSPALGTGQRASERGSSSLLITRRERWFATVLVALLSAAWVAYLRSTDAAAPSDLAPVIWGAKAWLSGEDPFQAVAHSPVWNGGLLYPFTAVLPLIPFSWIPEFVLNVLWVSTSAGFLTWMIAKRGISPAIVMLISPPMIHAVNTSQWTPLLLAAALSSWGGALLACKPTTALWLFAFRPRWQHLAGATIVLGLSLVLWPAWPLAWRAILGKAVYTIWPLMIPGGPLVLLALLRWRRPEARLLAAMVCVPHTMLIYETLPLFLIPQTWLEAGVLWFGCAAAVTLHAALAPYQTATDWVTMSGRLIVWCVYLPALIMVLRRREPRSRYRRLYTGAFAGDEQAG